MKVNFACYFANLVFICQMPIAGVIIQANLPITLTGFVILLQRRSLHSLFI